MTPAQQSALEGLVGRALTVDEQQAIEPHIAGRQDDAIASILSVGRTRLESRLITERGVISALGVVDGEAFIAGLESFAAQQPVEGHPLRTAWPGIKRAIGWLKSDGIDVGDPLSQSLIATLGAAGVVDAGSAAAIRALAVRPDPIEQPAVSAALNAA